MEETEKRKASFCETLLPGPGTIKFVIASEISERFTYYGNKAILVIFLTDVLLYSEPDATSLFFWYSAGTYLSPLLGGYVADAFLGKMWTIISFSLVYIAGAVALTIAATLGLAWLSFVGLVLIALGTGGIKPCVAAFGAQQFQDPSYTSPAGWSNAKLIETYFAAFYMSINFGSIGSFILVPIARKNVGFGAAFGMAAAVLIVSLLAFMIPIRRYVKDKPQGSVLASVLRVYAAACNAQARRRGICWCISCLCCCCGGAGTLSAAGPDDDTARLVMSGTPSGSAGAVAVTGSSAGAGAGAGAGVRAAIRSVAEKAKAAALPGRGAPVGGVAGAGDEGEEAKLKLASGDADVLVLEHSESLTGHEDSLTATDDGAAMRGSGSARSEGGNADGFSGGARHGGATASSRRRNKALALRRRAGCLNSVRGRFTDEVVDGAAAILSILPVFGIIAVFWALYDQQGNTWVLQAKKMDLGPFEPDQLGALSPILVLVLLPPYRALLIPCLERAGRSCPLLSPTPLRRMGVGMILAALTFLLSAGVEWLIEANPPGTVSVAWQLPQWVLITVAELFLSVTGLEWAYTQADKNLQGVCMASWFFSNSLGDLFGAVLYQLTKSMTQVEIFLLCAGLMVVASGVYAVIALHYQPRPTDDLVNSGAGKASAAGDAELGDGDGGDGDDPWWEHDGGGGARGDLTSSDPLGLPAGGDELARGSSADSKASIGTDYGTSGGDVGSVSGISMQHLDE